MSATAYIWSYRVKPEWSARFRVAYGPDGEWAAFFAQSPDFIRTELLADEQNANHFVTIDYFRNADARGALVSAKAAEYEAIDRRWRDATEEEAFLGAFTVAAKE